MAHWGAMDAEPKPVARDVTCFLLLEWAAYDDRRMTMYRATMANERPCPLIDDCPAAQRSRELGHRWPWEPAERHTPLFEWAAARADTVASPADRPAGTEASSQ